MAVLLVTGRNAADEVRRQVQKVSTPVRVLVCRVDVAVFLSPEKILEELLRQDLGDVSLIIVPGAVGGDMSPVAGALGIPCVKGPRNISDLHWVLEKVSGEKLKLSPKTPADDLLEEEFRGRMGEELSEAYGPKPGRLRVGKENSVFIRSGVTHVIAEIPDAPLLSVEKLREAAGYYVDSGAEIIDVGMVCGRDYSDRIGDITEVLRSTVDVPLSIDSLNGKEILAAVDAGVDLILSIDLSNCGVMDSVDVPAVLIPRSEKGVVPKKAGERISLAEKLMEKVDKGIVDLILDPLNLGFIRSIDAFIRFREQYPKAPMMMGAGNVTELFDADSVGVNALLAGVASELSIDLVFTTEASVKTRGSVKELSAAVKLMYLSKKRSQPPKDLGIDLLILKDKRRAETLPCVKGIPSIEAGNEGCVELEDSNFRIYVDDGINVVYYKNNRPESRFRGDSVEKIYLEVIGRGLIKDPGHAAYLGKELGKAEIALKLGKNYIQDEDLF